MTANPCSRNRPLFSISEHGFHQQFGVRGSYKEGSPLKRHGGDGVGIDGEPRIWAQRSIPQGLKALPLGFGFGVRVKTLTYQKSHSEAFIKAHKSVSG
ncbi:MAG: hypothetical protein WCD57_07610, partial [Acidobacteriaceae bacterium]